ncbi:MAG: sulfite exporter TauE/SafE family protein [Syntrophobacterales bacterium]|nr:sulfite exporter TauE/SafE family protein [Syntrophobacterales bacterium]
MIVDGLVVVILLVVFASALVRTVSGFGNALVAMPLLALTGIGMKTATPLVALLSLVLAVCILLQNWKDVDLRSAWRLLAATALGIPLGTFVVKSAYEDVGKILLALIIIGFSGYSLAKPQLDALKKEWLAYPFGFIAGILGGAYNSNGPPVVIYGTLRRWRPDEFRATLQGYFLPSSIIIVAGHGIGGLWSPAVLHYFLLSLPVTLLALLLGRRLQRFILPGRFDRLIHVMLIIIGMLLLFQAVFA